MILLSIYLLITAIVLLRMIFVAKFKYGEDFPFIAFVISMYWPFIFVSLIVKIIPDWWEDPWLCSK